MSKYRKSSFLRKRFARKGKRHQFTKRQPVDLAGKNTQFGTVAQQRITDSSEPPSASGAARIANGTTGRNAGATAVKNCSSGLGKCNHEAKAAGK